MDILSDILARMRLSGTLYFRTSFTSPWSVAVPQYDGVARFHFAHKGGCFVRIAGVNEPVLLEQGDLIIITRGARHTLYCDPITENQAIPLADVVQKSGFSGSGTLVYGEVGTDQETQLVCGHFAFDQRVTHPLIDALPSHIHLKNYGEMAGRWMETTLRVIGAEAGREELGGDLIALKMSEIVFAQALRAYLLSATKATPVVAAFADAQIAQALRAIHTSPSTPWTVDDLAQIAGMSRTAFATRFAKNMNMTPLNYIAHWRMQIARQMLAETGTPVIGIAEAIGYQSEAAFGRAFKKQFEIAPASYRREARQAAE